MRQGPQSCPGAEHTWRNGALLRPTWPLPMSFIRTLEICLGLASAFLVRQWNSFFPLSQELLFSGILFSGHRSPASGEPYLFSYHFHSFLLNELFLLCIFFGVVDAPEDGGRKTVSAGPCPQAPHATGSWCCLQLPCPLLKFLALPLAATCGNRQLAEVLSLLR